MTDATKPSILVCEDDPVQLAVLSAALGQAGFETLTARSPEEALERVRHKRADAVVADVQLMGGDAFDVLKDLRKRGLDAPVLVVSGHATPKMREKALQQGARDFLEKPLDLSSVVQGVRRIVETTPAAPPKPRILLLEAAEKDRHATAEALVQAGLEPVTAVDGLDAVDKVKSTKPGFDLAVIDLHSAALGGAPLVKMLL
ncbi:MAG TPA: response regulator [Planctomycetota bacterium]|nr:response regulator [Planctomycetota bacterium]